MDGDDLFNILVIVVFFLLPLLDKKKKKGKRSRPAKRPTAEEARQAEALLRHRGELLPNETMWQPDAMEEAVQAPPAVDDMMADEAEAAMRGAAHTAAYEARRELEEARTRAAEQAAYERAAKIPGMQPKPVMPRSELTAEKAREAIVLATILGAPKARRK